MTDLSPRATFKLNNFDLLRIFAASEVMVGHTLWHLDVPVAAWINKLIYAFPGVPIFFVISGFLISASYENSRSLKSYARNRALRIFPGLWCCIVATVIVYSLLGLNFARREAPIWFAAQLAGLIYTPHFMKNFGFGSYNGSLWSIPVELQFYILLPVLYACGRAVRMRVGWTIGKFTFMVWLLFVFVALAHRALFPPLVDPQNAETLQKLIGYTFVPHIYLFLTGILLQQFNFFKSRLVAGKCLYWMLLYLGVLFIIPSTPVTFIFANLLLGVTAISFAYSKPNVSHKLLAGNDLSYGVYIYHALVVNIFVVLGLMRYMSYAGLVFLTVFFLAFLSWRGVEKPFLLKKRQTISAELSGPTLGSGNSGKDSAA